MKLLDGVTADATLSDDGFYRYTLARAWGPRPLGVLWIMLNPSTATAEEDDPTLRRCQAFTRAWGYDRLVVANLFALRSKNPVALRRAHDPVGPDNDWTLQQLLAGVDSALVIAAWGTNGGLRWRDAAVISMANRAGRTLHALELSAAGRPKHPLYVKGDRTPIIYREART